MRARWWTDAALAAGLVALTAALAAGWFLDLDVAVRDWIRDHQPAAAYWTARVLNFLGNGTPIAIVTLGLAALLARRVRSLRPLILPLATFALTTVVIYALKVWTDRAAPRAPKPDAVELFSGGASYPSGHVVVTIVWYGVIVLLLDRLLTLRRQRRGEERHRRGEERQHAVVGRQHGGAEPAEAGGLPAPARLAVRLAPPVIVFGTTTYLNYHWLTDGIAAVLLGLLMDRLLGRAASQVLRNPAPH